MNIVVYFTQNWRQFKRTKLLSNMIFDWIRILLVDFMIWCKIFRNCISETYIEFCWISENVSHRAIFVLDKFNVYIFEHVNEHIAFLFEYINSHFAFAERVWSLSIVIVLCDVVIQAYHVLKHMFDFVRCVNHDSDCKIRKMCHQKCIAEIMIWLDQ